MIGYSQFITEGAITKADLKGLEKILDALFAKVGIDVEFTGHFLDRANDKRNKKQITIDELRVMFQKAFKKHGNKLKMKRGGMEAILKDIQTDINVPFVLKWDAKAGELDLITKTVMRKKNFKSPDDEFKV